MIQRCCFAKGVESLLAIVLHCFTIATMSSPGLKVDIKSRYVLFKGCTESQDDPAGSYLQGTVGLPLDGKAGGRWTMVLDLVARKDEVNNPYGAHPNLLSVRVPNARKSVSLDDHKMTLVGAFGRSEILVVGWADGKADVTVHNAIKGKAQLGVSR